MERDPCHIPGGAPLGGGGTEGGECNSALRDPSVRLALLESVARVFVHRPAELQLTLGLLLERSLAAGGELAAAAARLYATLEVTEGADLMDGAEADEAPERGEAEDEAPERGEAGGGAERGEADDEAPERGEAEDEAPERGEAGGGAKQVSVSVTPP